MFFLLSFALAADTVGDLFVTSDTVGRIELDGRDTGLVTPALLRALPAGKHHVRVRSTCSIGETDVDLQPGAIARAELQLVPAPGSLAVTTTPAGAQLRVDGAVVGSSPWTGGSYLCGDHLVVADLAGYQPLTQTVAVTGGMSTPVVLSLIREQFSTLVVDVLPLEAEVRLDGAPVGAGPRTLERIPAGSHTIAAAQAGYVSSSQTVDLPTDTTTRVVLRLEPRPPAPVLPGGRLVAATGVAVVGIGAGVAAALVYADAANAYNRFLLESDDDDAERIFDTQVAPGQALAAGLGIGSALLVATGTVLWVTTDFGAADGKHAGVTAGVHGTF